MNVRLYLSYDIKITMNSHFCRKEVIIFHYVSSFVIGDNISRKSVNH